MKLPSKQGDISIETLTRFRNEQRFNDYGEVGIF